MPSCAVVYHHIIAFVGTCFVKSDWEMEMEMEMEMKMEARQFFQAFPPMIRATSISNFELLTRVTDR